jgi:hypothetical protein
MTTLISPLAGKPAPASSLIDVAKLVTAYYEIEPDPAVAAQRVVFGTSGHRDQRRIHTDTGCCGCRRSGNPRMHLTPDQRVAALLAR